MTTKENFLFLCLASLIKTLSRKDYSERVDLIERINSIVQERKIDFHTPTNLVDIETKLAQLDIRIGPTDVTVLASAIEDNAAYLVTLETNLIEHPKIEKEFRIKIKHPRDLV